MAVSKFALSLLLIGSLVLSIQGDMYYPGNRQLPNPYPPKVIHVHHYNAGDSSMGGGMKMKSSGGGMLGGGGGGLMELIMLQSIMGNGGLFGRNNNNANAGAPAGNGLVG